MIYSLKLLIGIIILLYTHVCFAQTYTDNEKVTVLKELGVAVEETEEVAEGGEENTGVEEEEINAKKSPRVRIQRYKGLGEMDAEELWETTMNPEHRVLKRVEVRDAQEADKVFDVLMGTDVGSRKSFIQSNAKTANLDV